MGNEHGEWIMYGVAENDPRRIHTPEELINYVNQIGFLPLFRNALPGFSVEERTVARYWWTDDAENDPWYWRKLLAESGRVAYGKFFDKKAGFISLDWLPYFINARRDGYDFDARWEDGVLTVYGSHFTPWSCITLDGEELDTEFTDSKTITARLKEPPEEDTVLTVRQITSTSVTLYESVGLRWGP